MPYLIAEETYPTKDALLTRCRAILAATPDGQDISEGDAFFLFDLFQHHDEWQQKSQGGVRSISTQLTSHGTRCFVLVKHDDQRIDISFPHTVRLIPSVRSAQLQPQALRDFRSAARYSVREQIYAFRDDALLVEVRCPITGEALSRTNCAVDHTPPNTFDQLLFSYCGDHSVNPLNVTVGSEGGTVPIVEDTAIRSSWQEFHRERATLRLISRLGNLQLPKVSVPWRNLWP